MNKTLLMLLLTALCTILPQPVWAETDNPEDLPWETFYMNLGIYLATVDTSFRLGSDNLGIGIEMDAEDFLGMESTNSVFRFTTGYRYGETRRHHVDFTWFNFDRDSTRTIDKNITLPPEYGGGTISAGATINSFFNFDIYELKYRYSAFLDDRIDLHIGIGLYAMPFEVGLGVVGSELTTEEATAPLPVIGLGGDFLITEKWILRQLLEIFYVEYDNFNGSILTTQVALEYNAWENFGIGLGVDAFTLSLEVEEDTSYPGMDFLGLVEFTYFGVQLYARYFF